MEIHFSDHSLFKMVQRKIQISSVRKVVLSPDIRKPGNYPREEWYRRFGIRYQANKAPFRTRLNLVNQVYIGQSYVVTVLCSNWNLHFRTGLVVELWD